MNRSRYNQFVSECGLLPAEDVVNGVVAGLLKRQDSERLRQALIVQLANNTLANDAIVPTHTYAEQVTDTLSSANPTKRMTYHISPFPRIVGSAVCVILAKDKDGDINVLLAKNEGASTWNLPGGFMNPGQAHNNIGDYAHDTDQREAYEQAISYGKPFPTTAIQTLQSGRPDDYDKSLEDTIRREMQEETHIELHPEELQLIDSYTTNSMAGREYPYQQQCNAYLVDRCAQGVLPEFEKTKELAELEWVKLSDIQMSEENGVKNWSYKGVSIKHNDRPGNGHDDMIDKAIAKICQNEYGAKHREEMTSWAEQYRAQVINPTSRTV